jgi:hypothetical protein
METTRNSLRRMGASLTWTFMGANVSAFDRADTIPV